MGEDTAPFEVALARFEGKLDAWSMQQNRHEERLQAHSGKLDALQTQVTELAAKQAAQHEAKRTAPTWPAVLSAVIAGIALILVIAQPLYGGLP